MKGIELKTVNPVVFDDPENCGKFNGLYCKYLDHDCTVCDLFNAELDFNVDERAIKKCKKCKEHFLKAKLREECESSPTSHKTGLTGALSGD